MPDPALGTTPGIVDLFCGAGGLSLGFEQAGYTVLQAVERNAWAVATYSHNHPHVDMIATDITTLDPSACLHRLGLHPGDLEVLVGGPPCQGFSESNRRTRTMSNPNNHLYMHILRFVDAMCPSWVVIENVAGLRTMAGGTVLQDMLAGLRSRGYGARWHILNAADFGVPQLRRRLFIIANRNGLELSDFAVTHGDGLQPWATVRDAISDLPALSAGADMDSMVYRADVSLGSYQLAMRKGSRPTIGVTGNLVTRNAPHIIQRYQHIPQGGNWEDIPAHLLSNYSDSSRCHTGIYHRLSWDGPSKVIGNFRKNMLIHPEEDRGLSIREAARLQSFPDNYLFSGSIGFQQQQVADAVPPLLAQAVAEGIRSTVPR